MFNNTPSTALLDFTLIEDAETFTMDLRGRRVIGYSAKLTDFYKRERLRELRGTMINGAMCVGVESFCLDPISPSQPIILLCDPELDFFTNRFIKGDSERAALICQVCYCDSHSCNCDAPWCITCKAPHYYNWESCVDGVVRERK